MNRTAQLHFEEAQQYLDSLQQHKLKLGLEAMENFLEKVSRPDRKLRFVHVAGTNGKGSVSVNIVSMLSRAGYEVGLFTSPHLSSVRERFRVGNRFISEDEFARHASRVKEAMGEEMITYFEFTTALAMLWFAEVGVDLVVLETGLGGRLDATNVVQPLISVITNVSMDHEAYLGNDLGSVAFEKAGIIKEGIPLVTGVNEDISRKVVSDKCLEMKAPMYLFDRDFAAEDAGENNWCWGGVHPDMQVNYDNLRCGMKGDYQRANSSLAVAVLVLLQQFGFNHGPEDIRQGLLEVKWPGRLEYLQLQNGEDAAGVEGEFNQKRTLRYLLDGAHNPAGVQSLVQTLKNDYSYQRLIVLWGAMEDKDFSQTLVPVAELASLIVLTKPQGERAAEPATLYDALAKPQQDVCRQIDDAREALDFVRKEAEVEDLVLIAGSLYLIGEMRSCLVGELI